jgi:phage tail sheath protein FI
MPEYLAPGVYIEEVSFRAKSIEGLSTTTTGFIGPTRYGPVNLPLDVVTSIGEFERAYGDRQQMQFAGPLTMHNYMWHAVRSFFEEGGTRLYISRVFTPLLSPGPNDQADGRARDTITGTGTSVDVIARFPGAAGNLHVRITLNLGENILGQDRAPNPADPPIPRARGLLENDVVVLRQHTSPLSSATNATFAIAHAFIDTTTGDQSWRFTPSSLPDLLLSGMHPDPNPLFSDQIQVITVTVTVYPLDPNLSSLVYSGMALDPNHRLNGLPDSVSMQLGRQLSSLDAARTVPIIFNVNGAADGLSLLNTLADAALVTSLLDPNSSDTDRSLDLVLSGGNDGERPGADVYEGDVDVVTMAKTGLKQFEDIDEISIVAAPGSSYGYQRDFRDNASTIINLLIAHAEYMHYRIAVLDSGDDQAIADVRAQRAKIDSSYAALYYPWITILDPVTRQEIQIPPSGSVCGIYARNDITRAVYKAPANEVVTLAIGFEKILNKAQQDILNPLGVNCFRFFEDRGYRLWGGRTASSDPEWKYVNLRRYFAYLEHSIDKGTQWAVFEPNGDALWANVRRTISDFLLNEFQNGALLGDKPEKAYFVRCDRTTMTQNDLDNGRLVCLIGVAALRPAEYVIFRIGQWTADGTK